MLRKRCTTRCSSDASSLSSAGSSACHSPCAIPLVVAPVQRRRTPLGSGRLVGPRALLCPKQRGSAHLFRGGACIAGPALRLLRGVSQEIRRASQNDGNLGASVAVPDQQFRAGRRPRGSAGGLVLPAARSGSELFRTTAKPLVPRLVPRRVRAGEPRVCHQASPAIAFHQGLRLDSSVLDGCDCTHHTVLDVTLAGRADAGTACGRLGRRGLPARQCHVARLVRLGGCAGSAKRLLVRHRRPARHSTDF